MTLSPYVCVSFYVDKQGNHTDQEKRKGLDTIGSHMPDSGRNLCVCVELCVWRWRVGVYVARWVCGCGGGGA